MQPADVTLTSDLDDLDKVRQHFQLESAVLLGHSWGTVLVLEYALRHPTRVSHMILMNPAPASAGDFALLRKVYVQKLGADMDRQREIMATAGYKEGDPEAVAARYRLHFKPALTRPEDYEKLMATMKAAFISQGKEGILKARAVEDRLMLDTWQMDGYDLLPKLRNVNIPTLVISGDDDFIPGEIAAHIAQAIPNAHLVTLKNCGHFSYLECAGDVRNAFNDFFRRTGGVVSDTDPSFRMSPSNTGRHSCQKKGKRIKTIKVQTRFRCQKIRRKDKISAKRNVIKNLQNCM